MSYGLSVGWDDDIVVESGKSFSPMDSSEPGPSGLAGAWPRRPGGAALTKATELLWRVNDAARAAQVAEALDMEEDETMPETFAPETFEPSKPSKPASAVKLGPCRASCRLGLLALPTSGGQVRLLRMGSPRESNGDPTAKGLLQAQVEAGIAAGAATAAGTPALLTPVGTDAKVLLQKYGAVAADCFGDATAADAFLLAEALFGSAPGGPGQVMLRLSRWLSRVNQRTVRQYLDSRRVLTGTFGEKFTEAQCLEAVFHHLTANAIPAALRELRRLPGYDRLATIIAASGGTFVPGPQRRWLRQQLAEWKRQRQADALMSPELWRIYSLLAGDLEVLRECLDWRTAFGTVLWYGQCEEVEVSEQDMLAKVVTSFLDAVKQQGISSRIRPLPAYLVPADLTQSFDASAIDAPKVGQAIRTSDPPESLQFAAIRMAAGCSLGQNSDVAHFDYQTYTKDPMDIALSWHFSVLMLALQGDEAARAAGSGVAFQRLTQQYCKLLEENGSSSWAVYVAHFLAEPRSRCSAVRQLLGAAAARRGTGGLGEAHPAWPELPPGWLYQAQALACEQARDWCGALLCWSKCGGEEARAITIACGYLMGPAMLGHAFSPFKRGAVEAIVLAPMNSAARWLLQSLQELSGALGCHDVLWAEVGREALELLRQWERADSASPMRFEPQRLVTLHWKCEKLRKCMLGFPQ